MKSIVTPEYLLAHGFVQYKDKAEGGGAYEIPLYDEEDLHFRQKDFDRNMFVVVFSNRFYFDSEEPPTTMDYMVFVQVDAGCGFIKIPFRFYDLPIDCFEAVYFGIRGEKIN